VVSVARRWRPKLVALDVDGTLVPPGGTLAPRVREAVSRAIRAGGWVVLTSGRSTLEIRPFVAELGLRRGFGVCSNGAVTVRYPTLAVVDRVTFAPGEVVHHLLEHAPRARIAVEDATDGFRVTSHFPDGELHGEQRLESLDGLLSRPVTRVVFRDPEGTVQEFLELLDRVRPRGVSCVVGYKAWLDIGPQGVSKGTALIGIAERLGVPAEDCLAIGDGRNDIDMLQWAGRGVAMGQAPPEVRRAADDVTEPVSGDGVAVELERWFG
jgi:5-amino-6-(5-phospho-D-ribitylamino)uracil phosphatase